MTVPRYFIVLITLGCIGLGVYIHYANRSTSDAHPLARACPPLERSAPVDLGDGMILRPAFLNFHQATVRNGDRYTLFSRRYLESIDGYEVQIFQGQIGHPIAHALQEPLLDSRFPSACDADDAIRSVWSRNRKLGADRVAGGTSGAGDEHPIKELF